MPDFDLNEQGLPKEQTLPPNCPDIGEFVFWRAGNENECRENPPVAPGPGSEVQELDHDLSGSEWTLGPV